jgi:hypothetical protein
MSAASGLAATRPHEGLQHGALLRRQPYAHTTSEDVEVRRVQEEVTDRDPASVVGDAASEVCPHPGKELREGERLAEVVVRPRIETGHTIVHVVAGGEHHDGLGSATIAHAPACREPVDARQHHIEQHEVVRDRAHRVDRALAAADHVDVVPVLLERLPEEVCHAGLVLGDEDAGALGSVSVASEHDDNLTTHRRRVSGRAQPVAAPGRDVTRERSQVRNPPSGSLVVTSGSR